jgi:transposase
MKAPINGGGFRVRVKTAQRKQVMMHLHTLDELIREDHPARNVWRYVESLDLSAFYQDIQAVEGGVGRDAVDPRILLALWLFATIEGIGSARRLAELCTRDFAYLWICGEVTVNRDMLNTFRSRHPQQLDALMTETIGVLLHHNLVSLRRVAQDGMRVRASAGTKSFRREASLQKHLEAARRQVERMRQEDDDDQAGRSRQEAARQRAAQERLARLEAAIAEREKLQQQKDEHPGNKGPKKKEARASMTDPEARVMKMPDCGYRPAYNVQFATEAASRIIVGVDVTNAGADSGQMVPMVNKIEHQFHRLPEEYLADGGFSSREDTTSLEQRGVKVYSPLKKEQTLLDRGQDPYARQRGDSDEYYAYRQRMKTAGAKEIYKRRSAIAEFPNAGCRNRGLQQFALRGLKKTKIIAVWHALAHNLRMIVYHGWLPTLCPA